MPWPAGKSIRETTADVVAALDATNTNLIVINNNMGKALDLTSPRGEFIRNLVRALHGEAQVLDVIDHGESWADQGICCECGR